jgi:hypothetical protein
VVFAYYVLEHSLCLARLERSSAGEGADEAGGALSTGRYHGVDHCRELKSLTGVDEKWAKRVHDEIDSGDLDDMLSAAEKISRKLGAPGGGEYSRWLRETIRELKAERRDVMRY